MTWFRWNLWLPLVVIVFCLVFFSKKKHDADRAIPRSDFMPNLNLPNPDFQHPFRGNPFIHARAPSTEPLLGASTQHAIESQSIDLFLDVLNNKLATGINKLPLQRRIPIGEILVYTVSWNAVEVGEISMWTSTAPDKTDHLLLSCRVRTNSNPLIEAIYPVNNLFESHVHARSGKTFKYFKDQNEGRHQRQDLIEVDSSTNLVRYRKFKLGHMRRDVTYPAPSNAIDPLTALYHLRNFRKTSETNSLALEILTSKRHIPISFKRLADHNVKTPLGKFSCATLQLDLSKNDLFSEPGSGDARIYLEKNTGVAIKVSVTLYPPIGNVNIALKKWVQGQLP